MRKLTILATMAVVTLGVSTARAQGYGMAGCGLGALVMHDNSMGMQILAATTNGIGGQVFAITSGTSNCTASGVVKAQREQAAFAEVNFQDLKRNMAAGGGEYLTSFSTLLGCEDAAKPAFAKMTQSKYEAIVSSDKTTPMELLGQVKSQVKADAALAGKCSDERAVARAEGKGDKSAKSDSKLAMASKPALKSVK